MSCVRKPTHHDYSSPSQRVNQLQREAAAMPVREPEYTLSIFVCNPMFTITVGLVEDGIDLGRDVLLGNASTG
eukprot:CAMPEP_0202113410 /NCGR_PEP_ID=MMETSP0965-20130614/33841_1 /ASSEMBLY_ACC=CAM_ASM_000507 /TAXON_ID=4773 /ORGANISM="Schizochytrium aggregatum, Strain ATCC28209" /LENGTH=72 /DNA_ID=CAMNT_0048683029 /DNA_START=222 /DNA_END=440 /DNA_ORIENTATION=+